MLGYVLCELEAGRIRPAMSWSGPCICLIMHGCAAELALCRWVAAITVFQAAYLGMVYGITWAWIVGVIFPVPILLLVPIRQFLMPRVSVAVWHSASWLLQNVHPHARAC